MRVVANDPMVKAGSMARKGAEEFLRTQERSLTTRTPLIRLIDSSGVVPQICVMCGPCVAGAAYTPSSSTSQRAGRRPRRDELRLPKSKP